MKIYVYKVAFTKMMIAILVIVTKDCKQPRFPLTGEWIKKQQFICIVEYNSAVQKDKLINATTSQKHDLSEARHESIHAP